MHCYTGQTEYYRKLSFISMTCHKKVSRGYVALNLANKMNIFLQIVKTAKNICAIVIVMWQQACQFKQQYKLLLTARFFCSSICLVHKDNQLTSVTVKWQQQMTCIRNLFQMFAINIFLYIIMALFLHVLMQYKHKVNLFHF